MGVRSEGRVLALQALYCMAAHAHKNEELATHDVTWITDTEQHNQKALQFAFLIINGVIDNISQLNATISRHIYNWDITRLLEVDKAILRLSLYSLLYLTDIPVAVTINEAIELAKEYSDEHSPQFINGILDSCAKNVTISQ